MKLNLIKNKSMVELIFILIYLVSFAIHLIACYRENKYCIHTVGDLIDKIEIYMCIPIVNTLAVIGLLLLLCVIKIYRIFKLGVLWEKFRNIKI